MRGGRTCKQSALLRPSDCTCVRAARWRSKLISEMGYERTSSQCLANRVGSSPFSLLRLVERTHAWIAGFGKLRIRFERQLDIHLALLKLACSIICLRFVERFC